jgi:hypothetical protein
MDRQELEKMTVSQLREKAKEYEDLTGVTGMTKPKLIAVLAEKLGIDLQDQVPEGIGRQELKNHIRQIKQERDAALQSRDREALQRARRRLKHYRRRLRRAIGQALQDQAN